MATIGRNPQFSNLSENLQDRNIQQQNANTAQWGQVANILEQKRQFNKQLEWQKKQKQLAFTGELLKNDMMQTANGNLAAYAGTDAGKQQLFDYSIELGLDEDKANKFVDLARSGTVSAEGLDKVIQNYIANGNMEIGFGEADLGNGQTVNKFLEETADTGGKDGKVGASLEIQKDSNLDNDQKSISTTTEIKLPGQVNRTVTDTVMENKGNSDAEAVRKAKEEQQLIYNEVGRGKYNEIYNREENPDAKTPEKYIGSEYIKLDDEKYRKEVALNNLEQNGGSKEEIQDLKDQITTLDQRMQLTKHNDSFLIGDNQTLDEVYADTRKKLQTGVPLERLDELDKIIKGGDTQTKEIKVNKKGTTEVGDFYLQMLKNNKLIGEIYDPKNIFNEEYKPQYAGLRRRINNAFNKQASEQLGKEFKRYGWVSEQLKEGGSLNFDMSEFAPELEKVGVYKPSKEKNDALPLKSIKKIADGVPKGGEKAFTAMATDNMDGMDNKEKALALNVGKKVNDSLNKRATLYFKKDSPVRSTLSKNLEVSLDNAVKAINKDKYSGQAGNLVNPKQSPKEEKAYYDMVTSYWTAINKYKDSQGKDIRNEGDLLALNKDLQTADADVAKRLLAYDQEALKYGIDQLKYQKLQMELNEFVKDESNADIMPFYENAARTYEKYMDIFRKKAGTNAIEGNKLYKEFYENNPTFKNAVDTMNGLYSQILKNNGIEAKVLSFDAPIPTGFISNILFGKNPDTGIPMVATGYSTGDIQDTSNMTTEADAYLAEFSKE